jgi:DNA-binding NarL/FixJ family response regulator
MDRARTEIVGRVAELSVLGPLIAGAAEGRGNVVWVQGEPGIGKTALIDTVLAKASALGCQVFRSAGNDLMQPFPLRLMADCLGITDRPSDSTGGQIASLLRGEPGGTGAIDPVMAAAERMLELVDAYCAEGPAVLAVEDLHWADDPSLLVWGRLARSVGQIPLLLVGTTRQLPERAKLDQLRDLVQASGGVTLDLGPLDEDSTAELVAHIVQGVPGPRLQVALKRAAGNPLYVRELTESLLRDGLIDVRDSTAELSGHVLATPSSLTVAINSRLRFLPAEVRRALAVAALLGNEFDAVEWAVVTGHTIPEIADLTGLAVAGGVLSDVQERLRFRHELIHQVLLEQTPLAMRHALRTDMARLLAQAGRRPDSIARHLLTIPGPLDEWALDWLARLPETTVYALQRVSADLLARAFDSITEDDRRWEVLATRLACVLFWQGHDDRAGEIAAAVATRTKDAVVAARMRIQLIRIADRTGRFKEGLRAAVPLPGDERLPAPWQARLAAWAATLVNAAGETTEGAAMAVDALARATATGDSLTIGYAWHALAMCGDPGSRPDHIKAALDVVTNRDPESTDLRMLLLTNYMTELTYHAKQDETVSVLTEALLLAVKTGGFRAAAAQTAAAEFCYAYGRWDEALVYLATVDEEFTGSGLRVARQGLAALIALRRGDKQAADTHLCQAASLPREDRPSAAPPLHPLTQALALRAEASGDLAGAMALMSRWLQAARGLRVHERHDDMPNLTRLALAVEDAATARAAAEVADADMAADGSPSRVAAAQFCRALITDDTGALLAVAADYRAYGWLPMCAFALEEASVRLAAAGDIVAARSTLTDAARILYGMGASWDIRRADARLRPYGVRRGPRSLHRRATIGWGALTPSETRIADLVAQGLSNPDIAARLYLSRRTVQAHVSNILAKLQVNSRADIVRQATENATGDDTLITDLR